MCIGELLNMNVKDMVGKTLQVLESKESFKNPWSNYSFTEDYIMDEDLNILKKEDNSELRKKVEWQEKKEFKYQIPVPINGNFLKAEYLLLYSNSGTEKSKIEDKSELLKCFNLDESAELFLPNEQWESWYIGELDKFYIEFANDEKEFDWVEFSSKFCFINYLAYPTQDNKFEFYADELRGIKKLPSTIFAEELVEIGMEAGKKVIVIRRSEDVWKHSNTAKGNLFKKLSHSYNEYAKNKID